MAEKEVVEEGSLYAAECRDAQRELAGRLPLNRSEVPLECRLPWTAAQNPRLTVTYPADVEARIPD